MQVTLFFPMHSLTALLSPSLDKFIQPEAYYFQVWCKSAFTAAKNITFEIFVEKNTKANPTQVTKSNAEVT